MAEPGDPAPNFSGVDVITSLPFTLSDHFDKVIVIAFVGWT
ncbi:MAG TPA: hypothetical protein VF432_11265 [Thermoanaerobaculia bacterium]